jgi:hypothetical protein
MLLLFLPIFLAFWILYHSIQASPWLRARLRRFLFPKLARLLAPPSDDEDDDDEPYTTRTTWIGILVSTTRLNGEAEEWVNIRMGPRGRRWMRMFYEWLGLIFGIVGMTLVVTGLIIQSGKLAGDLWELVRSVREEKRALGRRQLDVQPLVSLLYLHVVRTSTTLTRTYVCDVDPGYHPSTRTRTLPHLRLPRLSAYP